MTNSIEDPENLAELSDQELLVMVRSGGTRAYGVLWSRHAGPAYGVARSFPTLDADDLVSEAFVKVLAAILDGRGPDGAFRPYITMTVRNLARSLYAREPVMFDVDAALEGLGTPSGEDLVIEESERSMMLTAFQSLPPRWQEVLWHSEVEGLRPAIVAQYLGIQPNAVSALLARAKRGLRDAWVSGHLAKADSPECRIVIRDLGGYVRGGLSKRATVFVDQHLATCPNCPRALEEARNASHLTLVLLPAVAGVTGAAAYSAQLAAPPLPEALVALGVEPVVDEPPGPARSHKSAALAIVAVLLLLAGTATTVALLNGGPTDAGQVDSVAGQAPPGTTTADTATPTPAASPPLTPSPDPDPDPGIRSPSESTVPPSPDATFRPGDAVLPATPAVPPREPDASSPDPVLTAPVATLSQTDPRMYPVVTGSGAIAGATIQLIDEAGSLIGTGTARADGTWIAAIREGISGTHAVRVHQVLGERTSPSSAPLAYTTSPPPPITAPLDGAVVSASSFTFSFAAPPGTVIQREIVGVSSVLTLQTPSSGSWNERVSVPVGQHVMRVRYADPATGSIGPSSETIFTAE